MGALHGSIEPWSWTGAGGGENSQELSALLKVAGRHRGDVEEAEVPASKSDRASREFLDL